MRISKETAAYHDIIWCAYDNDGRIIVANSNEGNLPEFAAENKERTQQLAVNLCGLNAIDRQRKPEIDYDLLASKGFYCFVNDDPYDGSIYRRCAKPQVPRFLDSLDEQTKQLLSLQKLPIDADTCERFFVNE